MALPSSAKRHPSADSTRDRVPSNAIGGGGGAQIFAAFDDLRRARPTELAVLDAADGAHVDRDGLARLVDRASRSIAASGVAEPFGDGGARVAALQLDNGAELIAAVLACWRDGIVPFPLDAEMPLGEVSAHLERVGLPGVLRGAGLTPARLTEALPGTRPGAGVGAHGRSRLPTGTALLRMTSGTTGLARAVAATGDSLLADVEQIVATMGIHERDRNLAAVPLSHCYGFDNVVLTLATLGCPAVVVRDLTPRHLLQAARRGGASVFPAVPFLVDLLARAPAGGSPGWPELRLVVSAGALLPVETRERFAARFGARPRVLYGSTECGGIAFDRDGSADVPGGCVGVPLRDVTVEIDAELDGVGRVRVRSRAVAADFAPPATTDAERATLSNGCFLTPDLARLDECGRVHLLGRVSEVINIGGRKVFPAEVEAVIRRIPGVREVAVVGVRRSAASDAVRAIVAASVEVDRAAVVAACGAALAGYKVPREIDFVPELPSTARGKIDRKALGSR
jgi:long-chain acyl-CoA synthetase